MDRWIDGMFTLSSPPPYVNPAACFVAPCVLIYFVITPAQRCNIGSSPFSDDITEALNTWPRWGLLYISALKQASAYVMSHVNLGGDTRCPLFFLKH